MAKVGNTNANIAATVIARRIRHLSSLRFCNRVVVRLSNQRHCVSSQLALISATHFSRKYVLSRIKNRPGE
jgi:hypothetical protein